MSSLMYLEVDPNVNWQCWRVSGDERVAVPLDHVTEFPAAARPLKLRSDGPHGAEIH